MLRHADALVCYRTYPHIDMAETGQRAAALLATRLHGAPRACSALRQLPYLIPLCWQSTDIEPARGLYQRLAEIEAQRRQPVVRHGFSRCGLSRMPARRVAHAATQAQADAAASEMERAVLAAECAFGGTLHDADEAVQTAMRMARDASRPVVIADAQDNPGAGGSSDTTGVLRALIRHGARDAAIGLIVDPPRRWPRITRARATRCGLHWGHSGIPDDAPLEAEFLVEKHPTAASTRMARSTAASIWTWGPAPA